MAPEKLDLERRELGEYFHGKRRRFEVPVDLRWGTEFQRSVLKAASRIPFGECWSYADVPGVWGVRRPAGDRQRLGKNPCRSSSPRVVASGGGIGSYTGARHQTA
jgi:O6-methylguanine-DNA--protein-cysteine methyltransferase